MADPDTEHRLREIEAMLMLELPQPVLCLRGLRENLEIKNKPRRKRRKGGDR